MQTVYSTHSMQLLHYAADVFFTLQIRFASNSEVGNPQLVTTTRAAKPEVHCSTSMHGHRMPLSIGYYSLYNL
jgi:hypothetical protein